MPEAATQKHQRKHIEHQLRELMITRLQVSPSVLEASDTTTPLLGRGIGLDSMEAMSLAIEIEDVFGIEVMDEDLNEGLFSSLDTLVDYIIKQSTVEQP